MFSLHCSHAVARLPKDCLTGLVLSDFDQHARNITRQLAASILL